MLDIKLRCISCGIKSVEVINCDGVINAVCSSCGESWVPKIDSRTIARKIIDLGLELGVKLPIRLAEIAVNSERKDTDGLVIEIPDSIRSNPDWLNYLSARTLELNGLTLEAESTIAMNRYLRNEWCIPDSYVLLSGDGHTWVALDYSENNSEPKIAFLKTYPFNKIVIFQTLDEMIDAIL